MSKRDYQAELKRLADALRNPLRLRLAVCGVSLAIAYFAIYQPLDARILQASRQLREAEGRQAAAQDTIVLKAQVDAFKPRLAANPDPNESIQYVLDGVRSFPLKLLRLDSRGTVAVGPYDAVGIDLEVSGPILQLDALVEWLEANQRLFRIDALKIEPPRGEGDPQLRLRVLALKVRP
jgi:type II secretory pathway component PulM